MSRPFEEILIELVNAMEDPTTVQITRAEEKEIADTLSSISGLPEFLKRTMGADMRRYFVASPDEQRHIKGAFARTAYLLKLALPKENFEHTKQMLSGPRRQLQDT